MQPPCEAHVVACREVYGSLKTPYDSKRDDGGGIRRNTLQWRMLEISPRTVRRDWEFARGWLAREQPPSSGRRA